MRRLFTLLIMLCAAASTHAQLPAASGTDDESHGWLIAQVPGEKSATLVHVPPRIPTTMAVPSVAGRLKAAASLSEAPIQLAADGTTVFMIFDKGEGESFEVAQLTAIPTGIQDNWVREPRDRLRFLPSIENADAVLGFATAGGRPTALVEAGQSKRLLSLEAGEWTESGSPALLTDSTVVLVCSEPKRLHVVERTENRFVINTLSGDTWQSIELTDAVPFPLETVQPVGVYCGELVCIVPAGTRHEIWSLGEQDLMRLGTIDPPGSPLAATVLHSTGRLVLAWTNADERTGEVESGLPAPREVSNPIRRVIEFSLIEGRTVYAGRAVVSSPVKQSEFRNLAFLMMLLMGLVLLVVLRPPADGAAVSLPPGLAIAGPGRRTLATFFDGLVGVVIVARALDLTVLEVLGPFAVPATGRLDIGPLLVALLINVFHCSVGEAVFGRSIGKSFMGLIVARVDASSAGLPEGQFRPPAPFRSLGRNLIKWLLPPVAMLALSDPGGRHRGDLLAQTAVLGRANPPLSDD
ncbi:MAG: hypothetical protein ED559_04400 [Phycisphaera sp.]|nr:MAG: hypothetical protein ED559_04400 [Phycisphaera sp.]